MLSMPSKLLRYALLLLLSAPVMRAIAAVWAADWLLAVAVGCTTDSTRHGCRLASCRTAGQLNRLADVPFTAEVMVLCAAACAN
jgi:hypothetical protein